VTDRTDVRWREDGREERGERECLERETDAHREREGGREK